MADTEDECIHPDVECERNSGIDACPCRCPECTEWESDEEDIDDTSLSFESRGVSGYEL